MNGQSLDRVTEYKNLGIIVSNDFKAAGHCHYATRQFGCYDLSNELLNTETIQYWYSYTKAW